MSESIAENNRNNEQHFYLPVPQGVVLDNARIEVRGRYFHPFDDRSSLTLLVNGEPVLSRGLFRRDSGLSLSLMSFNGSKYFGGLDSDGGQEISLTVPLGDFKSKGGFLDLGIVLSSQIDADHCVEMRGRGNELILDTKATRLSYSLATSDIRDIRTSVAVLSRRPTILLPDEQLTPAQYETALHLSLGLASMGMQAKFISLPKVGDWVDLNGLDPDIDWSMIPASESIVAAAKSHDKIRLQHSEQAAAWVIAHMLSRNGLAQIVVDSAQTRQVLMALLRDVPMGGELKNRIGRAASWLEDKSNLRLAQLAGQHVLLVDDVKATQLFASPWLAVANSSGMGLESATQLKIENDGDWHFAKDIPIQNITSSGEWQIPLRLTDFPDGKWPDTFELNLMAAPVADGLAPIASVMLNDNLLMVAALHTDGKITRISAQAPLYSIRANNILKVQINQRSVGERCSYVNLNAPVQLLPSSFVTFRREPDITQFYMLQPQLAKRGQVVVPASYLSQSSRTLPVVNSMLRGFEMGAAHFTLAAVDAREFIPQHPFIAFDTAPADTSRLVTTTNRQLVVRNGRNGKVFDSAGMGELAVAQLVRSHRESGIYITSVTGAWPIAEQPLAFAEGDFAVVDRQGTRLQMNLQDPDNDYQLDEQNRGVTLLFEHYRVWTTIVGLLLFPVVVILGLRYYFRRKNRQ